MTILQAIILGIVEGVTEYLPVSSTGHLILAQRAMGIGASGADAEAADAYAICIQLGAILAVLSLYAGHMRRVATGFLGHDREGLKLGINLVAGFLPAAVIGLIFVEPIKAHLFGLWPVVAAWLAGGIAILVVERFRRASRRSGLSSVAGKAKGEDPAPVEGDDAGGDIFALSWKGALIIGSLQCLAMWPGTSRSLVTILGGVLVGLNLRSAVIFSFLLGVITLGASTVYDGLSHGRLLIEAYGWPSLLAGFVVAFVSAVAAVRWMVSYLNTHGLALFGWYRIALAALVTALIAGGTLSGQ